MNLCALEQQTENLESEQQDKYCGVVKVHGDQLAFFPGFKSADANVDRSKVDRLKNIFNTEGCDRVNPTHQIPGNISASQLALALKSSGLTADGLRASSRLTDPLFFSSRRELSSTASAAGVGSRPFGSSRVQTGGRSGFMLTCHPQHRTS
uniref:Uncharacterized protein n=1 Tax=Bionectria ochroleuca TaxID=29856 RepID=A0A8H7NA92_BIOOC